MLSKKNIYSGKFMKVLMLFTLSIIFLTACTKKESENFEDMPVVLKNKLVELEGHLSYYFPTYEELGPLSDGEYLGSVYGSMIDNGEVKVVISNGEIVDVEILNLVMSPMVKGEGREAKVFEGLPEEVLEIQSPLVDSVSGATGSSHVFKVCVTRALWQASEKDDPMDPYTEY